MSSQYHVSIDDSFKTSSPVTITVDVPVFYQQFSDVLICFLSGQISETLNINRESLEFEKTGNYNFNCKTIYEM
jgi:hypothetical protein